MKIQIALHIHIESSNHDVTSTQHLHAPEDVIKEAKEELDSFWKEKIKLNQDVLLNSRVSLYN